MPIYEYKCPKCGQFECMQRISDSALKECPTCASKGLHNSVERLVSMSSFHLKGSGWYKTDYASSGGSSSACSSSSNGNGHSNGKSNGNGSSASKEKTTSANGSTSKAENASKSESKTSSTTSA